MEHNHTRHDTSSEVVGRYAHPAQDEVDFAYLAIKVFSDFGRFAGKPLAPCGVEALRPFWNRIQELAASGELNVALARRCTRNAAKAAALLAADSESLPRAHVAEAVLMVRQEAAGLAGLLCR